MMMSTVIYTSLSSFGISLYDMKHSLIVPLLVIFDTGIHLGELPDRSLLGNIFQCHYFIVLNTNLCGFLSFVYDFNSFKI
jgi:hypothetical protein